MKTTCRIVLGLSGFVLAPPLLSQESSPGVVISEYVAGEYRVFTGAGQPASLEDVVLAMGRHEVVFIGETHDDPTGHALELELLRSAHQAYGAVPDATRSVSVSLEFFQRDAQPILDEYLAGLITERAFTAASRPWPRYETDYRPVVEYARDEGLPVIAANAPARYANRVTRLGRDALDALGAGALATIAPLPYGEGSRAYLDQWVQVITSVMEQERMKCGVPIAASVTTEDEGRNHRPPGNHSTTGSGFDGQVLWDATMAYWISDHLARNPDALVLHMVGSFHVARGTGTPEHLIRYRPGATSMIVMLRPVEQVGTFEKAPSGEWGDFVIQTDQSHTLEAIECRAVPGV